MFLPKVDEIRLDCVVPKDNGVSNMLFFHMAFAMFLPKVDITNRLDCVIPKDNGVKHVCFFS